MSSQHPSMTLEAAKVEPTWLPVKVKFLYLNPADILHSNAYMTGYGVKGHPGPQRSSICLSDQSVTKNDFAHAKSNHFAEWILAWAGSDHMAMIMNSTLVWKLGDSVSIPSSVIKIVQQIAQSLCLYFYSIICLSFSQLIKPLPLAICEYSANVNKNLKGFGYAALFFFLLKISLSALPILWAITFLHLSCCF